MKFKIIELLISSVASHARPGAFMAFSGKEKKLTVIGTGLSPPDQGKVRCSTILGQPRIVLLSSALLKP